MAESNETSTADAIPIVGTFKQEESKLSRMKRRMKIDDKIKLIKENMEAIGENELRHEGWVVTLGPPPAARRLPSDAPLSDETILWAFREGLLPLNLGLYDEMQKAKDNKWLDEIRANIVRGEGTRPLSVKREERESDD